MKALNISLAGVWTALGGIALWHSYQPSTALYVAMCAGLSLLLMERAFKA